MFFSKMTREIRPKLTFFKKRIFHVRFKSSSKHYFFFKKNKIFTFAWKKGHSCNFRPVRCVSLCQKQRSGAPNLGIGPLPYLRHLSGGLLASFHIAMFFVLSTETLNKTCRYIDRYRMVFLVDTSVAGTLEALSDHFYALRGCRLCLWRKEKFKKASQTLFGYLDDWITAGYSEFLWCIISPSFV